MYYDPVPDPNLLWQGDVIKDFVLPEPPDHIFIVRTPPLPIPPSVLFNEKNVPLRAVFGRDDLSDAFASSKEALVVDAFLTNIAIVSQSCDIDRKAFLTVAMVRPISTITNPDRKENLKRWDKVYEYFWLPQSSLLEESFIDLTLLYSVRADALKSKLIDRIISMSISYRSTFKYKVAQYFNRPDTE